MLRRWPLARVTALAALVLGAWPSTNAAAEPWEVFPPGEGRREAFSYCSGCHSWRLVVQQGMSREDWDETLVWMEEEQGMPALPPELRTRILDYLAGAFPVERPFYRPAGSE